MLLLQVALLEKHKIFHIIGSPNVKMYTAIDVHRLSHEFLSREVRSQARCSLEGHMGLARGRYVNAAEG